MYSVNQIGVIMLYGPFPCISSAYVIIVLLYRFGVKCRSFGPTSRANWATCRRNSRTDWVRILQFHTIHIMRIIY